MGIVKLYSPGKPPMNIIICSGIYHSSWDNLQPKTAIFEVVVYGSQLLVYLILLIPLHIKRKKLEESIQPTRKKVPKSLESMFFNFMFIAITILSYKGHEVMAR